MNAPGHAALRFALNPICWAFAGHDAQLPDGPVLSKVMISLWNTALGSQCPASEGYVKLGRNAAMQHI
jgi:hypothetical protein